MTPGTEHRPQRPGAARATWARRVALALALALAAGCATGGGAGAAKRRKPKAPVALLAPTPSDSATILLWHLDDVTGYRVVDSGPNQLDGRAGQDTRIDLGRVQGARSFIRSVDSFIFADYAPQMETTTSMTIEAWIRLDAVGSYEDTPIAMRWNPRDISTSWIFTVGGLNVLPPVANLPSPGDHNDLLLPGYGSKAAGHLMFAYQPKDAGLPRTLISNQTLELNRWTHVAATFDGRVVRLYIDGRLDAQGAAYGTIRESSTPLLVGNAFDTRALTTFSGELALRPDYDHNPYYAFQGTIDELRLSSVVRTSFPYVR